VRIFHFSDRGDIESFVPRPPERRPETEALVYAIDEWHSPLYLFPRDCPRIGIWPVESTSEQDRMAFGQQTQGRMLLYVDEAFEDFWRKGRLYRYEFDLANGFEDIHDHGVWVSRAHVKPLAVTQLEELPLLIREAGVEVRVVPSLASEGRRLYDLEGKRFRTSLHVSMVRMALLPTW
jgi:hypothetical protein